MGEISFVRGRKGRSSGWFDEGYQGLFLMFWEMRITGIAGFRVGEGERECAHCGAE